MKTEDKEIYLPLAKGLRSYLAHSDHYRAFGKTYRAFIRWYLDARFGDLPTGSLLVTDRTSDGGIDAIVTRGGETLVFQSKYEVNPKLNDLSKKDIKALLKVRKLITERDQAAEFESWLKRVRYDVRGSYRELRKTALSKGGVVHFVLVTTRYAAEQPDEFEIEDCRRILSLWELYQEGFTPPTEKLTIRVYKKWESASLENGYKTFVALADVDGFRTAMDKDPQDRLFAQNIRTGLETEINDKIQKTFEKEADTFWLGNNGVYIVCHDVRRKGQYVELIYPSIVNGYQTLKSIQRSAENNRCKILVRILKVDARAHSSLLSNVIRRTNSQNPIDAINLLAHDPHQLNIARYLDAYRVYYERRQNEWRNLKNNILLNYTSIKIKPLTQWLSTRHPSIGLGTARSQVKELYNQTNYKTIFEKFDGDLKDKSFESLGAVVWSGLVINNLPKFFSRTGGLRSKAKISKLLLIKSLQQAINSKKTLREEVEKKLRVKELGKREMPDELVSFYRDVLKKFGRIQAKKRRAKTNLDFSNFFKDDALTNLAFSQTFTKQKTLALRKLLEDHLNEIL